MKQQYDDWPGEVEEATELGRLRTIREWAQVAADTGSAFHGHDARKVVAALDRAIWAYGAFGPLREELERLNRTIAAMDHTKAEGAALGPDSLEMEVRRLHRRLTRALVGCTCGDPSQQGFVHRIDGPCYEEDPPDVVSLRCRDCDQTYRLPAALKNMRCPVCQGHRIGRHIPKPDGGKRFA